MAFRRKVNGSQQEVSISRLARRAYCMARRALVLKFYTESSSGQRAREARRAFRILRVARRALYMERRASCFFSIFGARLLDHFWPLDEIQGSIFAQKTFPKSSYTLIQRGRGDFFIHG